MRKQKLFALLLAGTMAFSAFSFAGCGEKEEKPQSATEDTTEAPKELELPVSHDEALKMDYEKLYSQFRNSGFTEVDYEGLDDLTDRKDKQNETIESVTVDGKDSFNKGDKFMSNVKIRIVYHSVKNVSLPIDRYDLEENDEPINYEDAVTQYETAGFTDVSTRPFEDSSKPENTVKEISVDGKNIITEYIHYAPVDAKIVITYYTKKASESKTESKAESKTESKTESKDSDSGVVTASFKETMDSYEAFMDRYIAFMKKYKDNPTDMTLLSEYTDILTEYYDYLEKIEQIDTDSLTAADLAYYTEVTARVSKKLADAAL